MALCRLGGDILKTPRWHFTGYWVPKLFKCFGPSLVRDGTLRDSQRVPDLVSTKPIYHENVLVCE